MPWLQTIKLNFFGGYGERTHGWVGHPIEALQVVKCLEEVSNELAIIPGLDHHVINVSFSVAPNLPLEAPLDGLLIGGSSVLEVVGIINECE